MTTGFIELKEVKNNRYHMVRLVDVNEVVGDNDKDHVEVYQYSTFGSKPLIVEVPCDIRAKRYAKEIAEAVEEELEKHRIPKGTMQKVWSKNNHTCT